SRLGAKGNHARGSGASLGKWLRIDRTVIKNAPIMHAPARVVRRTLRRRHWQIVGERPRPQGRAHMHVPGKCGGAAVAAELGRGETIGRKIGAQASFLPWDADGVQALAMHVAEVLDREARLAVVFRRARRQNAAAEGPRLVGKFGLE